MFFCSTFGQQSDECVFNLIGCIVKLLNRYLNYQNRYNNYLLVHRQTRNGTPLLIHFITWLPRTFLSFSFRWASETFIFPKRTRDVTPADTIWPDQMKKSIMFNHRINFEFNSTTFLISVHTPLYLFHCTEYHPTSIENLWQLRIFHYEKRKDAMKYHNTFLLKRLL